MNCHECIHRRNIPGDAHSRCAHPINSTAQDNPMAELLAIMGKRAGSFQAVPLMDGKEFVTLNAHGVRNGWVNYPFNFDPVWIETCQGYTEKENKPND